MNAPSSSESAADRPSVFVLLAVRARRASDTRLVADAAIGTTIAVAIALLRPSLWVLAMPAAIIAAYGGWGIADRELVGRAAGASRITLSIVRWAALVLGVLATLAFVLGVLAVALGGWIL